jgi:hypothetical protein
MVWSNEWKNSEAFVEKVNKAFDDEFKTITIAGKPVRVIAVGDLGLEVLEDGWRMHHLPTLASFNSAVPGYYPLNDKGSPKYTECFEYEIEDLIKWMKKVQEQYPTSWQMLRLLTPENYNASGEVAKRIIKEWCLSVKVE